MRQKSMRVPIKDHTVSSKYMRRQVKGTECFILARFNLARCIIAGDERPPDSIHGALSCLNIAEKDYATLEILRSLADVQFLIPVL